MKKMLIFFVCLFMFIIINFSFVKADEDEFEYEGFTFGYGDYYSRIYTGIIVYCDHPDEYPHMYEPYPYWNPGYLESREELLLSPPESMGYTIPGVFSIRNSDYFETNKTFRFAFYEEDPVEGEYLIEVMQDSNKLLYSFSINMTNNFETVVNSVKWIIEKSDSFIYMNSSVNENDIGSISGFRLNLSIVNTGDIPYRVGGNYQEEIPISYKFNIYRVDDGEVIYSVNYTKLKRTRDLFEGNTNENQFFKPYESVYYVDDFDIIEVSKDIGFGTGDFSIQGTIKIDELNLSYDFIEDEVLVISPSNKVNETGGMPGFELVLFIFSISLFFIFIRKKKNKRC